MARKKKVREQVELNKIAAEGKAMGTVDGKVIFAEKGLPGQIVDVLVTKNRKDVEIGRVLKVHQEREDKQDAPCEHFEYCGGCRWQDVPYSVQLEFKQTIVEDCFRRIGKEHQVESEPILGSEQIFGYRNKVDFAFSDKRWLTPEEIAQKEEIGNRNGLGFHVAGAWDKVLEVSNCHLMHDLQNKIRNQIREWANTAGYSFVNMHSHEGLLRNLIIRNTLDGQWMVILVYGEDNPEARADLHSKIQAQFPEITTFLWTVNQKANDTIYDLEMHTEWGDGVIYETLGGIEYAIQPKSFFQTNPQQAKQLYDLAMEMADLKQDEVVYDLYTGTGSIALYAAKSCQSVIGIESVPEAIEDAILNAKRNGISNCTFYAADMKDLFTSAFLEQHGKADVIITDPPRAGMHADVVHTILASGAKRIVYVSCNPATQARDLQLLSEKYQLKRFKPVDMFPQTWHVENVALLELKEA